ncbi:sugar lactone lactonase YvrE [Streptosporangium becharense]|uniref:Sugar lactone lactonase YvrE n=1 Tax=Streptosporangium becharense TaxID=1816182 RepID=A0A7W9IBP9_9ACTN|nr:SMP-30/gluconolactonase/LRE family protein [Streptosporangium becharense]MBB2910870.1 sugar lactone lactonase YvrE [Streptosporangium becharense]MBB5817565.1 sugar lactone lactonase YvrE [Streptosporangium becharense]
MVSSFDAEPVLRIRADIGEGPAWDAVRGRLVWVDITACAVHVLDPATGADQAVDVGVHVGAAVPTGDGELLLAVRDGIARLTAEGTVRMVAEVEADVPGNRMNDAKCDPAGRLWAGTMPYDSTPGVAALYRYDGASVVRVLDGVSLSNGLGWSPDGTVMYYIDSRTQRVDAYSYDAATGDIRDRRTVVEIDRADGTPDGMTVDDDGCLWIGLWGGGRVRRYTPDGVPDREVRLPVTQVTSCAFGGPRGDVLYITSAARGLDPAALGEQPLAGSVFAVEPGVTGRPAVPFSG